MASRRRTKLGIGRSASRAFRGVNSRHFNKRFKQAWTITGYSILSDSSCSCSVDLWETTYSAYDGTTHPVVGDSIVASAPIALSSAYKYEDVTLTGWTKTIAVDNILHANVTSCGCTGGVTIQIYGSRGGF